MVSLQDTLNRFVINHPELEANPDSLFYYAYKMHPYSYLSCGFAQLPIWDMFQVLFTIDFKDIFCPYGMEQVSPPLPYSVDEAIDLILGQIIDYFYGTVPNFCLSE